MELKSLLNPEDENSVLEILSLDHLVKRIVSRGDPTLDETLNEPGNEVRDDVQLPSLPEQLKVLDVLVQVFENRAVLSSNIMRSMMFF